MPDGPVRGICCAGIYASLRFLLHEDILTTADGRPRAEHQHRASGNQADSSRKNEAEADSALEYKTVVLHPAHVFRLKIDGDIAKRNTSGDHYKARQAEQKAVGYFAFEELQNEWDERKR